MSPHTKGKEQAPITLKNISGEKTNKAQGEGGGGGEGKKMANRTSHKGKLKSANESHDGCSQLLGMRIPKTADLRHLRRS